MQTITNDAPPEPLDCTSPRANGSDKTVAL